jgi:hypothetical protein
MSKRKQVIYIYGTSYCGSSIANLMLNSQRIIRGLGEAHILYEPHKEYNCPVCKEVCKVYAEWDRKENFYDFCFKHYKCEILVDSSKNVRKLPLSSEHTLRNFVISKEPQAFAVAWLWEQRTRRPYDTIESAIASWIEKHKGIMEHLQRKQHVYFFPYKLLSLDPVWFTSHVCRICGIPFMKPLLEKWQETDTHIMAGNNEVRYQVVAHKEEEKLEELGSHMEGKYGRIFYDKRWMQQDAAFYTECLRVFGLYKKDLRYLLQLLGHGSYEDCVKKLETCLKGVEK